MTTIPLIISIIFTFFLFSELRTLKSDYNTLLKRQQFNEIGHKEIANTFERLRLDKRKCETQVRAFIRNRPGRKKELAKLQRLLKTRGI